MADRSSTDLDDALDLFVGEKQSGRTPRGKRAPSEQKQKRNRPAAGRSNGQRKKTDTPQQKKAKSPGGGDSERPAANGSQHNRAATGQGSDLQSAKTRMGRPPGVKTGEGRPKEKTSLSLDRDLMNRYRKQTWQEECQFGELIERALRDYAARTWGWRTR